MLVQQVLDAVHAEPVASGAGKEHAVRSPRRLLQPPPQHVPGRLGQGRAAFLAVFAGYAEVTAVAFGEVVARQPRHLGQPEAGLRGGEHERVVAPSRSGASVRHREQRVDLVTREKADLPARVPL